ncbi:MAG TPA: hydrogenase expression/formation protein HypE, partial [Armatimonadota bacterium]|nr:hydrogenase expression/formation protein HypE [Armatimonadota bacterium]
RRELVPACDPELGRGLEDAAVLPGAERLVLTTDSYVIRPPVFPGGDLGRLAVCGTVNDLAMRGARPAYLTLGLIVEEGTELSLLRTVMRSAAEACVEAGVALVTGDFKVVERGHGDGIFANTAGVGFPRIEPPPSLTRARPGDLIVINGPVGQHGVAILAARGELTLAVTVESDCAPLAGLVGAMLEAGGEGVRTLHDPTRGGLAAALNEIAETSGVAIEVRERDFPRDSGVDGACDVLGLDPLQVANEGKLVAVIAPEAAAAVLAAMRAHQYGAPSAIIGEVLEAPSGRVTLRTALGTRRIVDLPTGELLPRIC